MKAKIKNLLTGEIIDVHSTTDSVDSSYGFECWVDKKDNSYGQCQFGAPVGFELVECDTPIDQFISPGFVRDYFSRLGKKGGSATTPRKKSASAANLDAARKAGKVGGYPKGRPRNKRGAELYDLQKEYNDLKTQPDGELIGSFEDFVNDAVRQNSRQYPTLAEERKKSGMIII